MAVEIVIPEIGEVGMEVTFVAWYRAEGDDVTEGEPLFQLDTQKTLFDVESMASGRLAGIRVGPGDLVEPRQIVATILAPGDTLAAPRAEDPAGGTADTIDLPATAPGPLPAARAGRRAASPRARALASELGVDVESMSGTGTDGMITEADVRRAVGSVAPLSEAGSPPTALQSVDRTRRVRRAVADLTTRSWTEVPHFYASLHADLTSGLERAKPLPLVVGALAVALSDRPECHVGWGPDGSIVSRSSVSIGILVDTPDGLLLPIVHEVDRLSPSDLAEAIRAAGDRARSGRLSADDFGPRSATVSNLGMFAVDEFAGIVATPDPLLLSIGRARIAPAWDGTAWQPRTIATLTLAADHRILDGADAGRLLTALETRLATLDWLG